MMPLRRSGLALSALCLGLAGCGSGSYDVSKDPAAAPALQARADKIEQLKKKSAARYGRPVGKPAR